MTFLQELAGVLELEVQIVLVRVGAEADLLHLHRLLLRLQLLLLLLLLVEELLVVDDAADGRVGGGTDLHEVKTEVLGHGPCVLHGIDALFDVLAHHTHLIKSADPVVDPVRVFLDEAAGRTSASAWSSRE